MSFEKTLFDKIKNKKDLSWPELQFLERLLITSSIYNDLLDIQLGLKKNNYNLKFIKNEKLKNG